MKYNEVILEHFHNTHNVGEFADKENIVTAKVGSLASGNIIQLQCLIEKNSIKDTRIKVYGSVATVAAASWVSEWLKNKTIEEASTITSQQIIEALNISNFKIYSAVLAEDAVKAAIHG